MSVLKEVNELSDAQLGSRSSLHRPRLKMWLRDFIKTYKMILQIPFTTEKNKEQKIKKLKFDLNVLGVKLNKEKDGAVDTINPEAQDNPSLEYVVGLEIETEMTRSQLENTLEPDYKILKLREA